MDPLKVRSESGTAQGKIETLAAPRPVTKYMVTPEGGRIGNSRQVQPQVVLVETRPHNLERLGVAIVSSFHRYFRRYDAWVVWTHENDADNRYTAQLYCRGVENHLATFTVETIEEE